MMKTMTQRLLFLVLLGTALCAAPPARAEAPAPVAQWNVSHHDTDITFTGKIMGKAFEGILQKYASDIVFDPARLDESHIKMDFDITGLSTGEKDRDKTAMSAAWFDPQRFPAAQFVSDTITRDDTQTENNRYVVAGHLTIRDKSLPVTFPFTLDFESVRADLTRAKATAEVTLDRSAFGLGSGDWADTSIIANEVIVRIALTAHSNTFHNPAP